MQELRGCREGTTATEGVQESTRSEGAVKLDGGAVGGMVPKQSSHVEVKKTTIFMEGLNK